MKKVIVSAVLCGGVLMGMTSGITAQAADVLAGNTNISAAVTQGDVTLSVDTDVEFGTQPLSNVVNFGEKTISYTVMDYSGTTNGFEISAKVTDKDEKRSLKIAETELTEEAANVVRSEANSVGENTGNVTSALVYSGVQTAQAFTTTVEWNLTKGTTSQISE